MSWLDWLRAPLLWGLAAVALPIVIHLLGQRRRKTVEFATLRFLEKARVRASRRWRLRRVLLLASRVAALACLAVLFAGPGCRQELDPDAQMRTALVLDTSWSMTAEVEGKSALARAREELGRIIDNAPEQARFALLTTARSFRGEGEAGIHLLDRATARERLARARIAHGDEGVGPALERAAALLAAHGGGEIIVATDLQARSWRGLEQISQLTAPVRLLDVGREEASNAWIIDVEPGQGAVTVKLGASGPDAATGRTVRLSYGSGRELKAFIDGTVATFRPKPERGLSLVTASVTPGGDLAGDDALAFVTSGSGVARVLLVNGAPRGFRILDELLFLRRALDSGGRLSGRFEVREVLLADLDEGDLSEVDVTLIANPDALSEPVTRLLEARVKAGMGLIISGGDNWSPEADAGGLVRLIAAPLRDRVLLTGDDPSRPPYEEIDLTRLAGPLELFRDPRAGDLSGVRTHGYWLTQVQTGSDARVLAAFTNGAPFVVERDLGEGRLMLVTSSLDRDWSDLCLHPAFLPLLEQLLLYGAGQIHEQFQLFTRLGAPLNSPFDRPVTVVDPQGRRSSWSPGSTPFTPGDTGFYRVEDNGRWLGGFTARPEVAESDLTRVEAETLARLGQERGIRIGAREQGTEAMGRSDLSGQFALLLLLFLAAEALLSGRWRTRRPSSKLAPPSGGGA